MPNIDTLYSRAAVEGNTDVPLVVNPTLRGAVRRHDPDGLHPNPYVLGLTGTSLNLDWGTIVPSTNNLITVNFISDDYNAAIAAINAAGSPDISAYDDGGFIVIQSTHAGGKNFLYIPSDSTALTLLGFEVGEPSIAGDIATSGSGGPLQANPRGTTLVAKQEDLSASVINRAIVGSLKGLDNVRYDMEREIPVFRGVGLVMGGPGTSFSLTSAPSYRLAVRAVNQLGLSKSIRILDSSGQDVYNAAGDTKAVVTSITYGPLVNAAVPFVVWGVPDGKSVIDTAVPLILKTALLPITKVEGDFLSYTAGAGLGLENKLTKSPDRLVIQGATNTLPFDHNGEFTVVGFGGIPNTQVQVRPLGTNEPVLDGAKDNPRALNPELDLGTSYGSLASYVGEFVRFGMAGSMLADDHMVFNLNTTIPAGSYTVVLPVGVTLRELGIFDLLTDLNGKDPDAAYKHQANNFFPAQVFRNKITVGQDLLASAGDAETARTLLPIPALATSNYTLLEESIGPSGFGARLYSYATASGTAYVMTSNAAWTGGPGGNWVKDAAGLALKYELGINAFKISIRSTVGGTWNDSAWTDTCLDLKTGFSTNIAASNFDGILGLGAGLVGDPGDAILPRLKVPRAIQGLHGNQFFPDLIWTRTLVLELPVAAGETAGSIRLYSLGQVFGPTFSTFEVTFNAQWMDPGGGFQWVPDTLTQPSTKMSYFFGDLTVSSKKPGVASWLDSAWDTRWGITEYEYTALQNPAEAFNNASLNSVRARSVAKTWGVFSTVQNGGATKVATGDAILTTVGNAFPMNLNGKTLTIEFSSDDGGTFPVTRTHTFVAADPYASVADVIADISGDSAFVDGASDGYPTLNINSSGAELVISATRGPNLRLKTGAGTAIGAAVLQYTIGQTSAHSLIEGFSFNPPVISGMNILIAVPSTTTREYVVIITDEGDGGAGIHPGWVFRAVNKTNNNFEIAAYNAAAAFAQVDLSLHPNEVTLGVTVFAVQAS